MKNVRKLTEGAILLAVFAVLLSITIYIPIVGSIMIFVLPLPFIMFSAKTSLKNVATFFLASIFISFIIASLMGLSLMLIYGTTGVVIGFLLKKEKSRTTVLIASSLTVMAGFVISYAISVAFFKIDIIHELTTVLNESVKISQNILEGMGNEDQIKLLKEQNASMLKMIVTLAPSILIVASILSAFLTQWVCFPIAKRFGVNVQPWGSFRNLSLPRSLLWYYLIAMVLNILIHPEEGTFLATILVNLKYTVEMFLLLQGFSFIFYIFHQKSVLKGVRVLVVVVAFMIPVFHYIIMLLGIIDIGLDFRKRIEKKE
ncbi:MAG: YybS family protein [Bacillus sp. (in: Bacteria)]|nr:YybS family protein [Bacillus sp. (in: firmicutes)]